EGIVLKKLKTKKSRRTIVLPPFAVAALRKHRTLQLEERRLAPYWEDHDLVFCSTIGTPIDARNVVRQWHAHLKAAGITYPYRFYDQRHTAASLLLVQGASMRTIADLLGHS